MIALHCNGKRPRLSEICVQEILGVRGSGRDVGQITASAKVLYQWLKQGHSWLRHLLAVLCEIGGTICYLGRPPQNNLVLIEIWFSSTSLSGACAVGYRVRPDDACRIGISEDVFVRASRAHHCDQA